MSLNNGSAWQWRDIGFPVLERGGWRSWLDGDVFELWSRDSGWLGFYETVRSAQARAVHFEREGR